MEILAHLLESHEGMPEGFPPRVFFTDFGEQAFNIRVIYWYAPPSYWDYLAFGQKLNLEIMRAFDDRGISFSLPHRFTPTTLDGMQPLDRPDAM